MAKPKKPEPVSGPVLGGKPVSKKKLDEIMAGCRERFAEIQKDSEDKRKLTGKYAPEPGVCRVCKGAVVADIRFPFTDRLGGPPLAARVAGWHCESCGLVYAFAPPPAPPKLSPRPRKL